MTNQDNQIPDKGKTITTNLDLYLTPDPTKKVWMG